jgi:hypothetical protein
MPYIILCKTRLKPTYGGKAKKLGKKPLKIKEISAKNKHLKATRVSSKKINKK